MHQVISCVVSTFYLSEANSVLFARVAYQRFAPKAVKPEKRQLTLPTLTLDFSWRKYMDAIDHVKPIDGNAFLPDS